jgi:hypothetical protein
MLRCWYLVWILVRTDHPCLGVGRHRKVLECLISLKGIEAKPDNIRAILQMKPPQIRKDVQELTGKIAALNRFIVKLVERSLAFFMVLRGSANIEWGPKQ